MHSVDSGRALRGFLLAAVRYHRAQRAGCIEVVPQHLLCLAWQAIECQRSEGATSGAVATVLPTLDDVQAFLPRTVTHSLAGGGDRNEDDPRVAH
jgi:hypothetical protein